MKIKWKGRKWREKEKGAGEELHGYNQREEGDGPRAKTTGGAMKQHTAFSLGRNSPLVPSPQKDLQKPGKAGRKLVCLS